MLVWRPRKEAGREMKSPGLPQPLDWIAIGPATPIELTASSTRSGFVCLVDPLASFQVTPQCSLQCLGATTVQWDGHTAPDNADRTTALESSNRTWEGGRRVKLWEVLWQ